MDYGIWEASIYTHLVWSKVDFDFESNFEKLSKNEIEIWLQKYTLLFISNVISVLI